MTMQTETPKDPTNCNRCGAGLEGGWSERWRDNKRVEVVCFACDKTERRQDYGKTGILTSRMLIDGALYGGRERGREPRDELLERVGRETAHINAAVRLFDDDVWRSGFARVVRKAKYRGHRATFAVNYAIPCAALVWSSTGRVLFTLEPADKTYDVTLITAEDGIVDMGIQGICATWSQAVALIEAAARTLKGGNGFTRDDKIGML